jgi:hypothetical protein
MRDAFYRTDFNKFMRQESANFMFGARSSASIKIKKGSIKDFKYRIYFQGKGETRDKFRQ